MFKLFAGLMTASFAVGIFAGTMTTEEKQNPLQNPPAVPVIKVEVQPLPPLVLRSPIDKINYNEEQRTCLALNVYHEAKNQDTVGQAAVAMVTLNRVADPRFPETICAVVKHTKYPGVKHKCQFSWYCDGKSDKPKERKAWAIAKAIANRVLETWTVKKDPTNGAKWYHAHYVNPRWSKKFIKVATIQDHIFYVDK